MKEGFFNRIKLVEQFEMHFNLSKSQFLKKLSTRLDENKNSFSVRNNYSGTISTTGFNIRSRGSLLGRNPSNTWFRYAGEIIETDAENVRVRIDIKLKIGALITLIISLIFISYMFYLSISNNLILNENLVRVLFAYFFIFLAFYLAFRVSKKSSKKQIEQDLADIINN